MMVMMVIVVCVCVCVCVCVSSFFSFFFVGGWEREGKNDESSPSFYYVSSFVFDHIVVYTVKCWY